MKIGVISDTHSMELPEQIKNDFAAADLIIHAGDFCEVIDLEKLSKINEVKGVYGNSDESALRDLLKEILIFKIEDLRIGLYHGYGPPKRVLDFVKEKFSNEELDVIIYGHSHISMNQKIDKTLYFNPGSPNDLVTSGPKSYGMLEINDGNVEGKIIKLKD